MSRIGRLPVVIPAGVTVEIKEGNVVTVKGAKGTLERALAPEMEIKLEEGTVVVTKDEEGKLAIEIKAVNSCGIPVHIVYGNVPSAGVENINMNAANAIKKIVDGRLLIIRDGKAYNAIGAQVK
jgi:large subunit ribosomal protein L6